MTNQAHARIALALAATLLAFPSMAEPAHGIALYGAIPWTGAAPDALAASRAGTTIPMASFKTDASKDGKTYDDTIVGGSPFAAKLRTSTIDVLVVPLIVQIGSTVFDPTATDPCITPASTPLAAFQGSPLVTPVSFDGKTKAGHASLMNGQAIGRGTYPDAFRRAEFWSLVQNSAYHTKYRVTYAQPYTISAKVVSAIGGNVITTKCASLGVLSASAFQSYLSTTILPAIPGATPTSFVMFLATNIVITSSNTLTCSAGCTLGYHSAKGNPPLTYAMTEYDTTAGYWNSAGIKNISVVAHEVSEWMDDPLVSNPTPKWGGIGQVSGCQGNWEVGDPLTGTDFPAIAMPDGLTYDPQELVFYSWYYNAETATSLGAGGKFSGNGTFGGPSKVCPPGGTY